MTIRLHSGSSVHCVSKETIAGHLEANNPSADRPYEKKQVGEPGESRYEGWSESQRYLCGLLCVASAGHEVGGGCGKKKLHPAMLGPFEQFLGHGADHFGLGDQIPPCRHLQSSLPD